MVHIHDAFTNGHTSIIIRSTDTDMVVLATSVVSQLGISELWIVFGKGKKQRVLPAHVKQLGTEKNIYSYPCFMPLQAEIRHRYLMEGEENGLIGLELLS